MFTFGEPSLTGSYSAKIGELNRTQNQGNTRVADATVFYFHGISGIIAIIAKLNDKSDKFKCEFSYNYDVATY